jgi:signal transduction histidine kinase
MLTIFIMKNTLQFFFMASFTTTLILGALHVLAQRGAQGKRPPSALGFYGSLGMHLALLYLFLGEFPEYRFLVPLGWIWPLYAYGRLISEFTAKVNFQKWHGVLLIGAAVLGIVLNTLGLTYAQAILPISLVISLLGSLIALKALREMPLTPMLWALSFTMTLFSLGAMAAPLWGIGSDFNVFLFYDLIMVSGLGASIFAVTLERTEAERARALEVEFRARHDKIVGNSKYSELGMMAAGITHEINNPLAVIQARTTQLLRIYRDRNKTDELAEGLQQLLYTSERINRTIQGVREFVHDERVGPTDIKVTDLVDDVLAFCGQRMKNHGVNLRFYGLEDKSVYGNKIQLEQILLNLLNNAFDAIEFLSDKWIEISVKDDDDKMQIFVKDSGRGIPAEVAAQIMEPFYSTKDVGKGTGLGLALARGIAEKHGGSLNYLQDPAHTTFRLELPKGHEGDWGLPLH